MTQLVERRREYGPGDLPGQYGRTKYGWQKVVTGWDYTHPCVRSGPDESGWGSFRVASVYLCSGGEFLAVSFGAHWTAENERAWSPSWALCHSLESAQNFCEADMVARATVPGFVGVSGA